MAEIETIQKIICDKFGSKVETLELNPPQAAVKVVPDQIVPLLELITTHPDLKLNYLSAISAVDMGPEKNEIEIVYFLSSIAYKHKLTIKTVVPRQGGEIDTISSILRAANWYEREIWELFGVGFKGHLKLERFLLPDDWDEGHPMLKDWEGKNLERMPE